MIRCTSRKPIFLALFILPAVAAFGAVTMLLWNWLVPALFSGPAVTFWQALGLLILAKILFGSGHGRHHHHRPPESWKEHLHHKIHGEQSRPGTEAETGTESVE
jgi:hypothetical protein